MKVTKEELIEHFLSGEPLEGKGGEFFIKGIIKQTNYSMPIRQLTVECCEITGEFLAEWADGILSANHPVMNL